METKMADVTLHIDENLDHTALENLRDAMLEQEGVMAAAYHDEKPHLMIVEYNPDVVNSSDFIAVTKRKGIHAELISL